MSLVKLKRIDDFGPTWYIQILNTTRHVPRPFKNLTLFQASVSWNDFPSYPYASIKLGGGCIFSFTFWIYKFGLDIDVLSRSWRFDT